MKTEKVESFFNFFKNYDADKIGQKDGEDKDDDDDVEEDENEFIDDEHDMGLFIKEELIPYAIEYYLGVIKDEDDDFEDDEDFEDEEEEEEPAPKGKGKGKK